MNSTNNDVMTNAKLQQKEELVNRQGHNIYSTKFNSYFIIQFYTLMN